MIIHYLYIDILVINGGKVILYDEYSNHIIDWTWWYKLKYGTSLRIRFKRWRSKALFGFFE